MNHESYDSIIDRYRSGLMSRDEEREFQELLKTDPDLKRMYAAEMVLDRVMVSDREMLPADRPQAYAHFLGLLASGAPMAEQAAEQLAGAKSVGAGAAKTAAGTQGAGSGLGAASGAASGSAVIPGAGAAVGAGAAAAKGTIIGSLLAGGVAKTIIGAVATVGLAVGTYVTVPKLIAPAADRPAIEQVSTPAAPELREQSAPTELAAPAAQPGEVAPESTPAPDRTIDAPRAASSQARSIELKPESGRAADQPSKIESAPAPELSDKEQTATEGTEVASRKRKPLLHMKSDSLKAPVNIRSKVNSYDK